METKFNDVLYQGMTGQAFELGTVLFRGEFWSRIDGCHVIYRGQDGVIDHETIVGVGDADDETFTIAAQSLAANTIWHYVRRAASGCGLESDDGDPAIVEIDSDGLWIGATPNIPYNLEINQVAGAYLQLRWRYSSVGQVSEPTGFYIYQALDGESFDFDTPTATVTYSASSRREFTWLSAALVHGSKYKFCVRSYRDGDGMSQNSSYVSAVADSVGPAAITGLITSWEEVD